jgi:hypothetical protein
VKERSAGEDFARFLALEFARSMENLGFRRTDLADMKVIKIPGRNVSLYYLALFSKAQAAFKLWTQVLKYAPPQRNLFD